MNAETKAKMLAIFAEQKAKAAAKATPKENTPPQATTAPTQPAKQTPPPLAPKPVFKPEVKDIFPEVKTFDNMKDLEAAANNGEMVSIMNMYDLVKKDKPAAATPELSNFSIDALLNDASQPEATTPAPAAVKQAEPAPGTGEIEMLEYSELSFVVRGEGTRKIKDTLMDKGGKFNRHLKCGAGFVFSKKKYYTIKTYLESLQVKS